jgi:hypothetical protein
MREVTVDNGQGAAFYLYGDQLVSVSMVTGNSAGQLHPSDHGWPHRQRHALQALGR